MIEKTNSISIRSLDRCPLTLHSFLNHVWILAYEGKVLVPHWSVEELAWLFESADQGGACLLGAYDQDRLVGTFIALPQQVKIGSRVVSGAAGSWMAVHPDYSSTFIWAGLIDEMRSRLAKQSIGFTCGVAFPSKSGMSLEFWQAFRDAFPRMVHIGPKVPFWLRVIDGARSSKGVIDYSYRIALRTLGVFGRISNPKSDSASVRPFFQPNDQAACHRLLELRDQGLDFAYAWTADQLGRKLSGPGEQTHVLEVKDRIIGWANFHLQEIVGRTRFQIGLIDDVVLPQVAGAHSRRLLNAILRSMQEQGAALACLPKDACAPSRHLLSCGFIPFSLQYRLVSLGIGDEDAPHFGNRFHLHIR